MTGPFRSRHARPAIREAVTLLVGVLSAAALLFAAVRVIGEPGPAARASLARAAGEVADAVGAEWERLLREEPPPAEPVAGPFRLTIPLSGDGSSFGLLSPPEPRPVRPPPEAAAPATAFDALLAEARRLQVIERRPTEALDAALDALAADAPPLRRAEARLLAIQLAARLDRRDVVAAQWSAARDELLGDETLGDTSVLLLCGLAAAPALDDAARAQAAARLVEDWTADRLVLPSEGDALVTAGPARGTLHRAPRREALRRRLLALAPESGAAALEADAERRDLAVLLATLRPSQPAAPTTGRWELASAEPEPVLWRREESGDVQLVTVSADGLRARLARSVSEQRLVPDGFVVDFGGGWLVEAGGATGSAGSAGERAGVVRERTPLAGDLLGVTVRHADPAAFVDAERARAAGLRWALLLMALFSAGAALATVRAMRRERALAALRSAFVASVSHELRTPVSSLLLMTENLQAGRVPDAAAQQRYHGLIRTEAQRLRRLVDDVLDVSRLERGEPLALRREEIAPAPFVRDLAAALAEHVRAAGGRLAVEIGELPEAATLDADAIRRALLNLVENALRHSGSRALAFEAGTAAPRSDGPDAGPALRLAVADAGRGVPRSARARIFEPFARLEPDGPAPGTGLGLSIVRAIAEGHGGTVSVRDREPGPGAVFEILIPASIPEEAAWPSAS